MFFVTGETQFGPSKIAAALKENITGIQLMVENIDEEFGKLATSIGAGREQAFLLKQTLTEGLTEITRLGGKLSDIVDQQTALYTTFGTQITFNKNATDELFATTTATGQKASDLFAAYTNIGKSIYSVNEEMATIMETADLIGVNAQTVTGLVVKNMGQLSKFNFKDGVTGLADMAAKSVSLRMDMDKAVSSAKELYKPEKAQEFVNTLSRMGVAQTELMDVERVRFLSRNDPKKLMEEVAKIASQFVDETGKMSAVGMDMLAEIESAAGYSPGDLEKAGIAYSQLLEKQKEINAVGLKGLIPDEKEMQKLENILVKGKDGKFEVTFEQNDQQVTKALQDMSEQDRKDLAGYLSKQNEQIEKTFEAKPGEDKDLKKLIEQQMDVNKKFSSAVEALSTVVPSQAAGSKSGEKMIEAISENTNKISTKALESLDKVSDDIGKVIDAKISMMSGATEIIETTMPTMISAAQTLANEIRDGVVPALNTLKNGFSNVSTLLDKWKAGAADFLKMEDFISLPGKERLLVGQAGVIGSIDDRDTIIGSTDGPKTEEEVKMMMDLIKNPGSVVKPSPAQTNPIFISEGGQSSTMNTSNEELTKIMMDRIGMSKEELPRETKTTTDINHKLDIMVDLKNVPNGTDKDMLKSTIESVVLKPEFVNNIKTVLTSIKGFNYQ